MNLERNRLESFYNWPKNAPVASSKIARAGFFYTGADLEVQCYFCNEKLNSWSYGDQVMLKHRLMNPSCPFVLNPLSCGNVIIKPQFRYSNHSNDKDNYDKNITSIINADSKWDLKNGLIRLRTFLNDPIFIPVKIYLLAVKGFYCTNEGDSIRCVECNLLVKDWIGKIDPILHHKNISSNCPKTKNIFLHSNELYMQGCVENAYSAEFSTFKKRLETYGNWPHKYPDPGSLSFAGLYYTKDTDFVRCYHCDIGLRKWLETDNPLVEHARNSSTCKFLIELTSETFIQKCIESSESPENGTGSSTENISKLQAQIRDLKESKLCKICLHQDIAIAFVPCGHLLTCERCAIDMLNCPLCRGRIHNTVRTYLS